MEIIRKDSNMLFASVGKIISSSYMAQRDRTTFESDSIANTLGKNRGIELDSYIYLDFNTGILSFLSIKGSPTIDFITALLNNFENETGINFTILSIMTDNALELLRGRDLISRLEIRYAEPSLDFLNRLFPSEKDNEDVAEIRNSGMVKADITFTAENQNSRIASAPEKVMKVIKLFQKKFSPDKLKFVVRNPDGSNPEILDLIQHKFTANIKFPNNGDITPNQIEEKLKEVYFESKNILNIYK